MAHGERPVRERHPLPVAGPVVNAWAARSNVQNWAFGTAADGTTRCLSPDGGSARWDQIWLS